MSASLSIATYKPKVDRNCFCRARFLCHRNGSPDEMISTRLAQDDRQMIPYTHSGGLSKN
jgi:hypothetical protein